MWINRDGYEKKIRRLEGEILSANNQVKFNREIIERLTGDKKDSTYRVRTIGDDVFVTADRFVEFQDGWNGQKHVTFYLKEEVVGQFENYYGFVKINK